MSVATLQSLWVSHAGRSRRPHPVCGGDAQHGILERKKNGRKTNQWRLSGAGHQWLRLAWLRRWRWDLLFNVMGWREASVRGTSLKQSRQTFDLWLLCMEEGMSAGASGCLTAGRLKANIVHRPANIIQQRQIIKAATLSQATSFIA